jgi:hypothetical protein
MEKECELPKRRITKGRTCESSIKTCGELKKKEKRSKKVTSRVSDGLNFTY